MVDNESRILVHRTVAEALTVEAMVLADELETYLADGDSVLEGMDHRAQLSVASAGVAMGARLTRLVDWLVWRDGGGDEVHPLESAEDELDPDQLPPQARALFAAAQSVFSRAAALDQAPRAAVEGSSPARTLQMRLVRSLEA